MPSRPSWRRPAKRGRHAADRPPTYGPPEGDEPRPRRRLRSADSLRRFEVTTLGVNARRLALEGLIAALQRASDLRGTLVWDHGSDPRVVLSFANRAAGPAVSVRAELLDETWCYVWAPEGGGPGGGVIGPVEEIVTALEVFRRELRALVS